MIGKTGLIEAKDFKIGLFTQSDIINANPDLSPNCMDIQWFFDASIGKRLGSSTANSTVITTIQEGTGVGSFIVQNSLTNNLVSYWKMDESSDTRYDSFANFDLIPTGSILSETGIRNGAALFSNAGDSILVNQSSLLIGSPGANWSISTWVYMTQTDDTNSRWMINKGMNSQSNLTVNILYSKPDDRFTIQVSSDGSNATRVQLLANSLGGVSLNTWYNIIGWVSNNSHVGISVNLSVNTAVISTAMYASTAPYFAVGGTLQGADTSGANITGVIDGRIDETSVWSRVLTSTERTQIYAGGSGNTYTNVAQSVPAFSWYSFDFGASQSRWLTVCAGTGIFASSNAGTSFVTIASTRTASFQYLDRSRNVLIATSDAYDQTLYWAGSAGTFAVALAVNSAPKAKFSVNYQGFCILLNSMDSNNIISSRRFSYADENFQLTDTWEDSFDIPSSADDEITGPFILNKFLYVSTKYKIFRINYTGGNPDWQYIQVKNFGYVPRTVKVFTLKQGQVAVGLDWSRKLLTFY